MNPLKDFFNGRYGGDYLNMFLNILALVLITISSFTRIGIFSTIGLALLFYGLFRVLSRNIEARYAENQRFVAIVRKLTAPFRMGFRQASDREHRYYTCPSCHQMIRVPRGKGAIEIRCPKCDATFVRRT
jgi:LSD1 subclass zinc finger protein